MKTQEVLEVYSIISLLLEVADCFYQCMDACQEKCTDIHSVVAQALLESANSS